MPAAKIQQRCRNGLTCRLLYGTRISLFVSMASMAIGLGVGTLAGMLAGFYGGMVDVLLMRLRFDQPMDCSVADRPGLPRRRQGQQQSRREQGQGSGGLPP